MDIWALPMQGEPKPFPIVKTRFADSFGTLSPDGRYFAYSSNESGRSEVYVQEFPEPRNKWQVSTRGGTQPFWRADGRELYYRSPDARIMAIAIQKGSEFKAEAPQPLFQARFGSVVSRAHYRPSSDGLRFLVLTTPARDALQPTQVVLNWAGGL